MKHALVLSLVALSSMACSACGPRGRAMVTVPKPFVGETQTMSEVVAEINANNAALPTLWARHQFEANIFDDRGRKTFANGDGILIYKSPRSMRLVGNKDVAGTVFEIGSSEDRFWLTLSPPGEQSRMWWGNYRNLGKPCMDMRQLPVRPDMVLEVLGVGTIDTNFLAPPAPVMRFNNDARAYMFVWSTPLRDRWAAQKEIWYDLETKLPRRVFLFDEDGRVVLRAKLSNHAPLESDGAAPPERAPKIARRYELFFPDTGSTMEFDLGDVAPERKGVPTRIGIAFPKDPKADHIIQLDKDCTD
jgi:hypothetical protein